MLESQYQSSLSAACKSINTKQKDVAVECSGYILEELRDPKNYEKFKREVAEANIFIGSLIFVRSSRTRSSKPSSRCATSWTRFASSLPCPLL